MTMTRMMTTPATRTLFFIANQESRPGRRIEDPLLATVAPVEHRELPRLRPAIVAHQISVPVVAAQLEVAMIRREPLIENFRDANAAIAENDRPRRFLATMSGVTLHLDFEQPVRHRSRHRIQLNVFGVGGD